MPIILSNKIIYSPKRIVVLTLAVIAIVVFSLFFYFYVFAQTPDNPIVIHGSQFEVCTADVSQPACYSENSPEPILNWTFTSSDGASSQIAYWIQIDNNGNDEGSYPSPEVDTGEVLSSDESHTVNPDKLQFNTTYYWKVAVEDNFGTWSGWTCADVTFTTNPPCNNPPTVTNLSVTKGDYCTTPVHYFSWTYSDPDGDNESQFQFQVDNNSGFDSPEVDQTYGGLSNPSPTTNNQTVIVAESPGSDLISYSPNPYYWRVRVWDEPGADSGWISYNDLDDPDGDGYTDGFTTEAHRYPTVDFSWSPLEPSQDEDVQFTDGSTCYTVACTGWDWDFESDTIIDISGQQNPIWQFTSPASYQVTLIVTDATGYSCSGFGSGSVSVQVALPDWQEVLPW